MASTLQRSLVKKKWTESLNFVWTCLIKLAFYLNILVSHLVVLWIFFCLCVFLEFLCFLNRVRKALELGEGKDLGGVRERKVLYKKYIVWNYFFNLEKDCILLCLSRSVGLEYLHTYFLASTSKLAGTTGVCHYAQLIHTVFSLRCFQWNQKTGERCNFT